MSLLLVMMVLASVPDSVFENTTAWKPVDVDGALTVEKRAIADSAFNEYRISTTTELSVELLCSTVFEWGTKGNDSPSVKLSKLLKDGPDERVVYTQIEQPLISNRDYAMTVRKASAPNGGCRIRFKATNDQAPAAPEGFVRMEHLWGGWDFEPLPGGATKLTHFLFADPGGSVPTFLVHGGQKNSAKKSVLMALDKGRAAQKAAK